MSKCPKCGNAVEGRHDRVDCPYYETAEFLVAEMFRQTVADEKDRERTTGRCYPYPGTPRSGRWSS